MKRAAMVLAGSVFLSGCMMPMMCGMKHDGADHASHGDATTTKPVAEAAMTVTPTGAPAPARQAEIWKCPMGHVTASAPGTCPTCGMALVKAGER